MSKEQTTQLKGIAILLMLILHLFNHDNVLTLCSPLIFIGDKPLISFLVKASNPVSFFMILSGYGLTYLYMQKKLSTHYQKKRLTRLYIHYWIILAVFVSLGHFINPEKYPHSLVHLLGNISGLYCSYNGEAWFLLPYAVVCMLSSVIIRYVYNLKNWRQLTIAIICYAVIFLLARHLGYNLPGNELYDTLLIQPVYLVQLTFYFSLGIILYRLLENEPKQFKKIPKSAYFTLLCLAIIVKSLFKITIADGFYAFVFIFCFVHLHINSRIRSVLHELGRCSMPMWLSHTFYSAYLFPEFIYGFEYPILIFSVLVVVSYLTAIPVLWIDKRLTKTIAL